MIYYQDETMIIRDIQPKDSVKLFSWWVDDKVNQYDVRPLPYDEDSLLEECNSYCQSLKHEVFNENEEDNIYQYFMIDTADHESIGFINIFDFDESYSDAELGIIIGNTKYWGQGIGKKSLRIVLDYLFNVLGFEKIHVETGDANLPAKKLFSSLGFKKSGEYYEGDFKYVVMVIEGMES
jgi:diamine N-acetyltransferase